MNQLDDKTAYIQQLEKSKLYQILRQKCNSDSEGTDILSVVHDTVYDCCTRTKLIVRYMKQYTLHDELHLFRVLFIMELLIPDDLINSLSLPEIMLLILCAFFHDLGMAPSEKEFEEWNKCFDIIYLTTDYKNANYNEFKNFCESQNYKVEDVIALYSNGKITKADQLKDFWISEFIRKTHANRARKIIEEHWNNRIKYHDVNLTSDFSMLCYSHNESISFLSDLDAELLCGQDTYVSLPFVAAILRLADILDFDAKRTPSILFSQLNVKDPISIKEWQKHRAIQAWEIKQGYICFHAKCSHPAIEATIKEFFDLIDKELVSSKAVISDVTLYSKNNKKPYDLVHLPSKVDRSKVEPEKDVYGEPKYLFRNTQFMLEKKQVIDLLMGTKLYGKTDVALRELIQNSIDACLVSEALHKKWGIQYIPKVSINLFNTDENMILEVEDNGIGMDQEVIDKYYSKVGSSFYKSPEYYELKAQTKANFQPTSRFGIGILSCFMITDEIHVETKKIKGPAESSQALDLKIQGYDSIFYTKKGRREFPGTLTTLYLNNDNPWAVTSDKDILEQLRMQFPNPPFNIDINIQGVKATLSPEMFLRGKNVVEKPTEWKHENIAVIKIDNINKEVGIACTGFIGILQNNRKPCKEILSLEKTVEIDRQDFELKMYVKMNENEIVDESDSISINSEGDINPTSSYRKIAKSFCKISLHGISIPMNLFPDYWDKQFQEIEFTFPFVCDIKVDILYNRDIDLNSARNEIINNEKWNDFYSSLCKLLLREIQNKTSKRYWKELKNIFKEISTDPIFKNVLNNI